MAELVPQHALQFFAGEIFQAAGRNGHHGVARLMTGGKGVDARLMVEHVDRRHGHAGGQRHLLDHVQQPPFGQIDSLRVDGPATQHQGNRLAAGRQLGDLIQAPQGDHDDRSQRDPDEKLGVP